MEVTRGDEKGFSIFISNDEDLATKQAEAYTEQGMTPTGKPTMKEQAAVKSWLCERYYDIRAFGAVLASKKADGGKLTGPVQVSMSRSVDPVDVVRMAHTRIVRTDEIASRQKSAAKKGTTIDEEADVESGSVHGTMGQKMVISYGLYRTHVYFNPHLAQKTGFNSNDLSVTWEAFSNLFEMDRTSARGNVHLQAMVVFKHASKYGEAHASELFRLVSVKRRDGVEYPRSIEDYEIMIDTTNLPNGVTAHVILAPPIPVAIPLAYAG